MQHLPESEHGRDVFPLKMPPSSCSEALWKHEGAAAAVAAVLHPAGDEEAATAPALGYGDCEYPERARMYGLHVLNPWAPVLRSSDINPKRLSRW